MRIDSAGNVGVGVTSVPSWANLMTNGTVAVGGTLYMKTGNAIQALSAFPGGASDLKMQTGGGKVTIGGPGGSTTGHLELYGRYSGSDPKLSFRSDHPTSGNTTVWDMARITADDGGNYNGVLHFQVAAGSGSENNGAALATAMTIQDTKYVGIGTITPSKPLHVQFSGDHGVRIESEDNHASLYVDSHTGYGQYIRFTEENSNKYWINSTGGNLVFRPAATGTAANKITFNATGNVGIGTATLTNKIHVNGNARIEGNLMAGGAAASNVPARPIHVKSAGDAAAIRIEDTTSSNLVYDLSLIHI